MYDARESASVPQLPRTTTMTRLRDRRPQNKAPTYKHWQRTKRSWVVVAVVIDGWTSKFAA